MNKTSQTRYMKVIVALCIATVIAFAIGSYVSAWFGVDTVPVLNVIAVCLGGELMLTAALKLMGKEYEAPGKTAAKPPAAATSTPPKKTQTG